MPSTILIVDDDPVNYQTLEAILAGEDYLLEMANNGQEALEMLASNPPDVILLDIMMPGMDGYEVCRRIRQKKNTAEIPIIMLTSLSDRESLLSGFEAGADDFITRPVDRYELRARLASITKLNRYRCLLDERAQLARALQDLAAAYDATLQGWSRALDLRDNETGDHSQRVMEITVNIARRYGMPERDIVHLKRGALLHDIGKMGIPDAILHKPDILTPAEMEIMRKHPGLALKMLEPVLYLGPALEIPYCHHEKWDSSGYPQGLKGEQIPLSARIFAVADVWDALTSDRPYRPAWSEKAALDYIAGQSGSHFEPQVVEIFLDYMTNTRRS